MRGDSLVNTSVTECTAVYSMIHSTDTIQLSNPQDFASKNCVERYLVQSYTPSILSLHMDPALQCRHPRRRHACLQ